jgi:membrane-bound metal-dependent hydrolase YbcI (DUF457 family)
MSEAPNPKPKRGLSHSLLSGLIVLLILWFTRQYWGGQGIGPLILAALVAGIMAEYATTQILRLIARNKPPKD